jgi:hypothetical protein
MKIGFGNPTLGTYEAILHQLPDFNFATLTRSTVPFMSYWRSVYLRMPAMLKELGMDSQSDGTLYFEYPVASAQARYKPSFTDAMYVSSLACIAIEGKWTEAPDKTVGKWLAVRPGRKEVLDHWRKLILRCTSVTDDLSHVPYQFIHRTASVCSLDCKNAAVVFEMFDCPAERKSCNKFAAALDTFVTKIGFGENLQLWKHRVSLSPTKSYYELKNRPLSPKKRPYLVRDALISGELF